MFLRTGVYVLEGRSQGRKARVAQGRWALPCPNQRPVLPEDRASAKRSKPRGQSESRGLHLSNLSPVSRGTCPTARCSRAQGWSACPHRLPLTFLAMMRPEGLCWTLVTTPPFPAPSSEIRSKSSSLSSPTLAFWVRKASSRFFCCSSSSSSASFFWRSTKFALQRPQGQGLVKNVQAT